VADMEAPAFPSLRLGGAKLTPVFPFALHVRERSCRGDILTRRLAASVTAKRYPSRRNLQEAVGHRYTGTCSPQPTLLVPADVSWRGRRHPEWQPGINGYLCSQPHEVNVRGVQGSFYRPRRRLMHV
jgi:hypothetical protein